MIRVGNVEIMEADCTITFQVRQGSTGFSAIRTDIYSASQLRECADYFMKLAEKIESKDVKRAEDRRLPYGGC